MTKSEVLAQKEIKQLNVFNNELYTINDKHDNVRDLQADDLIQRIEKYTRHLIDKDGNNIDNFFYINAYDNHDLANVNHKDLTKPRIHNMIVDTIKAIQGDTDTLLHE